MNFVKKVRFIISKSGTTSSFYLITGLIAGTILESFSIGLIMPLIIFISQGEEAYQFGLISSFINATKITSHLVVLLCVLAIVLLTYLLKSLFITFLIKKQHQYIFELESKTSEKLFKSYLQRPYSFHLQHNSSELIKNIYFEIKQLVNAVNQAFTFFSESLILLFLFGILIYFQPVITLISILFLASTILIFMRFVKHKTTYWGNDRKQYDKERVKILSDGLGNIKDIKLYGRGIDFYNEYKAKNQFSAHASMKHATFLKLPSVWLEFLAVFALLFLIGIMAFRGNQLLYMLPLLSLFTAATFRILPSLNRLSSAYQIVRFNLPVINTIYNEFCALPDENSIIKNASFVFADKIELKNVSFAYQDTKFQVLKNITLNIKKEKYIGLIGKSGAGKSTLVDILIGLLEPSAGNILVDGKDLKEINRAWQDQIGYVSQVINLTDDSIKKNIAFGINELDIDQKKLAIAIEYAQLQTFINSLPNGLETIVGEKGIRTSGGQRQRIGIARALYNNPQVLVFDEATNSLDTETELEIMQSISRLKNKKTIIMITHKSSLLKDCDHVYELKNGQIYGPIIKV